jgi:lipopolysaccharide transport system ATP-binding protein
VSLEIGHGETVGIIGNNGTGKSTLLKILSRITRPSSGSASIHGSVAALLEVGTGFHPELTGRENIFLNGVILGMSRSDIARKFDEIVSFAEVARFLDTPVKHYSSGMYLRLAFAVAAHLEPDILLIDEVLGVGDAGFQRKCLGKMNDVARQGRTVLFVSHNLGTVQSLCRRGVMIREGRVVADGKTSDTVAEYLRTLEEVSSASIADRVDRGGKGLMTLTELRVSRGGANPSKVLATGRPARFACKVDRYQPGTSCAFDIYDQLGQPVTYFDSSVSSAEDVAMMGNESREFVCELDQLLLVPGRYHINAGVTWNGELQDFVEGAIFIDVEQGTLNGRPVPREAGYGAVCMPHRWLTPGP